MKKVFIVPFVIFSLYIAQAQESRELIVEGKKTIEKAWLTYNKEAHLEALSIFERVLAAEPDNLLALYHRSFAEYRLLTVTSSLDKPLFASLIDKAIKNGETLLDKKPDWSEALTIMAGLYTMKIVANPEQAMAFGPKSDGLLEQAIQRDEQNPRAYLLRGISSMNKPAFFGGGADKALPDLQKAVQLITKDGNNRAETDQPSWGASDALAWLGQCYERLNRFDEAITTYKQALIANPEFGWVKQKLLPRAEQKRAAK